MGQQIIQTMMMRTHQSEVVEVRRPHFNAKVRSTLRSAQQPSMQRVCRSRKVIPIIVGIDSNRLQELQEPGCRIKKVLALFGPQRLMTSAIPIFSATTMTVTRKAIRTVFRSQIIVTTHPRMSLAIKRGQEWATISMMTICFLTVTKRDRNPKVRVAIAAGLGETCRYIRC